MKVRALISFSGTVSMTQGQTIRIEEGEALTGLLSCGYVEEVEEKKVHIVTDPIYVEPKQEPEQEPEQEPVEEPKALTESDTEQVPAKKASRSKSKAVSADESK